MERAKLKLTQTEVAGLIGVSQTTIANYEKGLSSAGFAEAYAFSDLLGITLDELCGCVKAEA